MGIQIEAENCHQVFDWLWTSGQLTESDIAQLPLLGIEVVINLAMPDTPNALQGEAEMIAGLGLTYIQIPVPWEQPKMEQFEQFTQILEALKGRKLWVHCVLNMRVSVFIYLYRKLILHESDDDASSLMREVWEPNEIWHKYIDDVSRNFKSTPRIH